MIDLRLYGSKSIYERIEGITGVLNVLYGFFAIGNREAFWSPGYDARIEFLEVFHQWERWRFTSQTERCDWKKYMMRHFLISGGNSLRV